MTGVDGRQLLLVTVGTDHHPFDRLVRWVDAWLGADQRELRCLMQTGTSAPPSSRADWQAYLEFDALQAAMGKAAAIVCHGGPGTILGARHMGAVPIVVPRRSRLGEHVDDHQVAFSRRLGAIGEVFLAATEDDLHRLLDRVVVAPAAFRRSGLRPDAGRAVQLFERLVEELLGSPAHDAPNGRS